MLSHQTFSKHKVIIGIFGGMGPLTGYDYFNLLVSMIPANDDNEHPTILFWSDPTIPRKDKCITALEENSGSISIEQDARPGLKRGMQIFKFANVSFVVAPCNTFHYFREELEKESGIEILNMIAIVAQAIKAQDHSVTKVGLLSTTATAKFNIYDKEFTKYGIEIVNPIELEQEQVQKVIELVKIGKATEQRTQSMLLKVIQSLEAQGIKFIILGCTELPLVIRPDAYKGAAKLIDSTFELAKATLFKICSRMNWNISTLENTFKEKCSELTENKELSANLISSQSFFTLPSTKSSLEEAPELDERFINLRAKL